jgi:N-methylhydantoinase B/oxoprolinase/acetone carboxylase alpha subunit
MLLWAPGTLQMVADKWGVQKFVALDLQTLCEPPPQVAANNRGIQLVGALIKEYGLDVVHAYMAFIQVGAKL